MCENEIKNFFGRQLTPSLYELGHFLPIVSRRLGRWVLLFLGFLNPRKPVSAVITVRIARIPQRHRCNHWRKGMEVFCSAYFLSNRERRRLQRIVPAMQIVNPIATPVPNCFIPGKELLKKIR